VSSMQNGIDGDDSTRADASTMSGAKDRKCVVVGSSTESKSTSPTRGLATVLEKYGSFAPAVVILGYVLGFVISNTHLARYQLVEFELLEGRYLAAAVLFTIFTVPPIIFGYALGAGLSEQGDASPSVNKGILLKVITSHLFGYLLSFLALFVAFEFIGVIFTFVSVRASRNPHGNFLFYWLLVMVTAFIPQFLIWHSHAVRTSQLEVGPALALPIQLFFMLVVTAVFGRNVYPEISAAFGGGGAWMTNVEYADGQGNSRIRMANIVVLDRDAELLTLLPCYPDAERKPNSLLIPVADVKRIEMLREVTVSECQSSHSQR
jgi:hypothetical protein